ncbi:MAG TPA: hypothetical protein DIW52_11680, partial [Pseudomonas sp.]|nr:hypothetical protein [Pseudomonas sp.]
AASVSQLLYLPSRPVAIQLFDQRSAMEDWLSRQALVPTGLPTDNLRFEYTARTEPMVVGASDLFAAHQQAQISALRHGSRDKSGLAEHGAQSLAQADQVDRQRSNAIFFASPPNLEHRHSVAEGDTEADQQPLFGSLFADIPWSQRQAALHKEHDALQALLEKDSEAENKQQTKASLEALETAEETADAAAYALLYRSRTLDLTTFNREFNALYQAHKDGLYAEASLQLALGQLDSDEYGMLKAVLDTPVAAERDTTIVAASLTLSSSEQKADNTPARTEALNGPFVITRSAALLDLASTESLLLYWPGSGAGLQRFANRRALERQVFKIQDQDKDLSVHLKTIETDPLLYSLNELSTDFDAKASVLHQQAGQNDDLEILRQQTLAALQVPVRATRSLAFAHLQEQYRSGDLASNQPDWLRHLAKADRTALKSLIEVYIPAMQRSHELMTVALEPRDDFTRKRLYARLRQDFAITGSFEVKIDLPDSARMEKQYNPGAGHSGYKLVLIPSTNRSKMPLEELAQLNIDNTPSMSLEPFLLRLSFMQVEVTAPDESERQTLKTGITLAYLKRVLPELDLPKAYEQLIRDAFMGAATESAFVREHRRESLIEPWALILKLQGEFARLQKQIDPNDLQILTIAIDANTPQAWNTDGKRIVLLPAYLSPGGADTPNEGPVTLSGVTFIEEQVSGVPLLYLPDSPDDQFLRRYDSLEAARNGLFNLCLHDKWVSYLAGRALQGNVPAHVSRINQAMLKNFDALIGVGERWPATTSLAAHLLNAHMGRLIEAHRGTSRSNDALYMERYSLQGPRAFNYIKMAVGLAPFVGTVLSLYDAWTAANQAVAAFLRGDVGDGLVEVESILLSLIDAVMDLLPGEAASSVLSRTARSITRVRQLRRLFVNTAAMRELSKRKARHLAARFADYDYEQPISLSGLQPGTDGLYRNVYRHADGYFIVRQGRIFQVELSATTRSWRLSGNSRKTYKQPIALDETGQWDTWFGVYGTTSQGTLLGGGQVYGHLADALDPLWPQAIRQRLPRWWADMTFRRYHQLTEAVDNLAIQLENGLKQSDVILNKFYESPEVDRPALMPASDAACIGDIEKATRHYQKVDELLPLTRGNKRRVLIEVQSKSAWITTDRYIRRVRHVTHRGRTLNARLYALDEHLDSLPDDSLSQRLSTLEQMHTLRVELVREFDQLDMLMQDLNLWYERIKIKLDRDKITPDAQPLIDRFNAATLNYLRTSQLLEIVKRYDYTSDVSWLFLQQQSRDLWIKVDRALFTQFDLPTVSATKVQRSQILQECLDTYTTFRRDMKIWTASYPQHFHLDVVEDLMKGIDNMAERARKGVIVQPAATPAAGEIQKKVFTTEDDQLLIGVERWDATTQKRQYTLTSQGGYEEIWEQGSDNKFRLLNPRDAQSAPPQSSLAALVAEAQKRLAAQTDYHTKVQSYADQDMLPVDLEHMMVSEADELTRRALRIEELDAQNTLIRQLREKATELKTTGREMRTRQSLTTRKPTDGMLEDLLGQNVVEIRKTVMLKKLGDRKDGRPDYMQEYEIWDTTLEPAELLWYAHFHYTSARPAVGQFEKAHLKLPEHRFLTHADDADLPYADIGKRSAVVAHFEAL